MDLMDEIKIIDVAELFKIFGDSTRIKIINVLLKMSYVLVILQKRLQ